MKNVSFLILLTLGLSACGGKHGAKTKSSQLFPFCNNGKCGYTNENGELVIDLKFSTASSFSEGVAKLTNENNLYGFIDSSGNYVIEPQFEDARDFHEGLACVKKNNLYGFIDRKGNVVIDFQYSYGGDFIDSLALVAKGEVGAHSWGWINRNGETVIPFSYTYALPFKRGEKYTFVQPGNWAWTIIDRNDKSPCKGGFYNVDNLEYYIGFSDGLTPVIDENLLFGYVDETCSLVIPHQFEVAFRFNEGMAPAVKNGKVGLIDKKGNWVFEPKYASCNYFISEGLLGVKNENDNWGYVDSKGNLNKKDFVGIIQVFPQGLVTFDKVQGSHQIGTVIGKLDLTGKTLTIDSLFNFSGDFINPEEVLLAVNNEGRFLKDCFMIKFDPPLNND